MNAPAQEIRKGRKYDQVIEGARQVFLSEGFEGASVDDIARAAGVSKATLYSYFPDKRLLFMEVTTQQCKMQADAALDAIDMSLPVRDVLRQVADQLTRIILSDMGKSMFRVCVAESERFPEIGQQFYQSGPGRMKIELGNFLRDAVTRGELRIDDFDRACMQMGDLCKGDLWMRNLLGLSDDVDEDERQRVIEASVDMFMARYGT